MKSRLILLVALWLHITLAGAAADLPLELEGQWYKAPKNLSFNQIQDAASGELEAVPHTANTGGRFVFKTRFSVPEDGMYVIDFKNSSVIGRFIHHVYDGDNRELFTLEGGIQSSLPNPYLLRHGRELRLAAGNYQLLTEIDSPFYLAQPHPYIDTQVHYRQAIKQGNALVLICMGAMLILMIYYATLGIVRRQLTDLMYACFILGNLLYNGTAMLVLPDLLGMHYFYLISIPILFSNIAYIFFVTHLLGIQGRIYPRLHMASRAVVYTLCFFIACAVVAPNWSLELDRIGVGFIMLYGLAAGTVCAFRGNLTARFYLVAIAAFFIIGSYSITNANLPGIYTIYIEHFGMVAVTVEMVLLALVLARQFAQLHYEKEHALILSERNLRIAYTDALTGLPNRYALDRELDQLPRTGVLLFLDIDGLKFYNDNFGHKRGDELLCTFAEVIANEFQGIGVIHRLGGDEFAVTCPRGDVELLESKLQNTTRIVHSRGFDFAGISYGIAWVTENNDKTVLKHLADTRMYANKRQRKHKLSVN